MTIDHKRSWYSGRDALIVGGLGYIGWNLTTALLDAGSKVTVVTPQRARHEARAAACEARGGRVIEADVRDRAAMRAAARQQVVIFNVSGQSGALRSVQEPAADLDVNCAGSLSLLEALRHESAAAKLVFASSRLTYGAARALPVAEDHPLAPLCPHGAHKMVVEQYLAIYSRLYGVRATSLRITNPYGPGQPSDRSAYGVINYLIHRALSGQSLPIYGDGRQLRDYVYVSDVVEAMLIAGADAISDGKVYNIGSGAGTAMVDAARLIVSIAGAGHVEHVPWPALVEEIDTGDFVADISRAAAELGWRPTATLTEGLQRTIAASMARSADR